MSDDDGKSNARARLEALLEDAHEALRNLCALLEAGMLGVDA